MTALSTKVLGYVRGLFAPNYQEGDDDKQITVNNRGDQMVAASLPALTEVSRMGDSFGVMSAVTAALTAVPTTTAGHSVYNMERATGRCYVIQSFGCVEVVADTTQQNSAALFAMNSVVGSVAAPTDAGLTKVSLTGRARTVAGGTVVDNGWQPHATLPVSTGGAIAGQIWRVHEAKVDGLYIVQPGGQFNVAVVKSAATASQIRYFIRWHEIQLITRS